MAIDTSQSPYFDDFNSEKNFHKVLFRPSFPVQARELTTSQSILQDQVSKFGNNIFKNGSIVTGGQTMLETSKTKYVCVQTNDINGNAVDVNDYIGKFVVDGDGAGVRAYVIAAQEATLTTPVTLVIKYASGQTFNIASANAISTEDGTSSVKIITSLSGLTGVTSNTIIGNSSICSIDTGVFFIDGFFVQNAPQTIILDAYGTTPTYRIGLQKEESIVTTINDSSLLDPALNATNYQAPGADRLKITLTFSKRALDSDDDTKFIELLRVQNGNLIKKVTYPIYSVLEDTLARRTNDQSGSFTVRPFKIAFDAHETYANAFNIVVEPGKAYIQGYEFETIAPQYLKVERARSVANVTNYATTIDYQNWIEVTNMVGPIPFKTLQSGTIHCVPHASINVSNAAAAVNTAIGTVRIRAVDYQSGANGSSISTAIWRAYTIDANVGASLIANCSATGTANTMRLGTNFSPVSNAYVGIKFTITKHAGVSLNETHVVGSYNGPTNTVTLPGIDTFTFGIPTAETQYRLDYELKDAESIVYANTVSNQHVFSTKMDVSDSSKYDVSIDPYRGAFLTDTQFNKAILELPYAFISAQDVVGGSPITNTEYFGRKIFPGVQFTQNVTSITSSPGIVSAINGAPVSGSDAIDNVLVVVRGNTGSSIANNQVINFSSGNPNGNSVQITTTSNTSTWTITVPNMGSASLADVYVKVKLPYSHSLGNILRSKTARIANIASGLNSGGVQIPDANNGLVQWYSQAAGSNGAQITFYANSAAWLNLKDPTKSQSIFTSDVIALRKVYDVGQNPITDGNVAIAADITTRYTFDSGQRDNVYDHASIRLKPGQSGPTGNVVVYVDYLAHSGLGYLTVDSYLSANIAYANIPSYTSPTTGTVYSLRDSIDFRPRRQDGDFLGIYDEAILGVSGLTFETDFSYYLARVDKVVLTRDRVFEVLRGLPSLTPVPPADKDNSMTLYTVMLPPFTANTTEIRQQYTDNRRYTMRDIGTLEQRIQNLEYYTSLNLLEQAAKNQEITDDVGANRFKNGIIVDSFTGHGVGDVVNQDYRCAIDEQEQELRPSFNIDSLFLELNNAGSTNYARIGGFVVLPFTELTFLDQSIASQAVNVNPFNTVAFIGNIKLDPSSDTWVDTKQAPDVHVNLEGDNDAWAAVTQAVGQANPNVFGTKWNSWQTTWAGITNKSSKLIEPQWRGWLGPLGHVVNVFAPVINRTVTDLTQRQVRTGVKTSFVPQTITRSIGNKVVDVSVVPTIRSRGVLFAGKGFLGNTDLYAFFDDTPVTAYCNRPAVIKVDNPTIKYKDDYQNSEIVRVFDPARGTNTAFAQVVFSRNEDGYSNVTVVSVQGGDDSNVANSYVVHSTNSTFLIGETSGSNSRISGYYHNSGFVTNPNTNSIILQHDAANSNTSVSNTSYVGQKIYFTSGPGAGQSSTITSYNFITRNIGFTPVSTTLGTNTSYSIGTFRTDRRGEISGIFIIPSSSSLSFRTGERPFLLSDSIDGVVQGSGTNGSVKYFAQGLLETKENTLISTRVPTIQRSDVEDNRTIVTTKVTDTVVGSRFIGYWDPLAQTFGVDPIAYPSGVMMTAVRLLIKSKDPVIPLQVQLRPVVNGFPHSSQVIPGSDVIINPEDCNIVSEEKMAEVYTAGLNPLDDATLYTEVRFAGPVFLQQGAEYCVVLMANSVKYTVYISHIGSKIIGTDRVISEQPYLGVLFKSQNSTTWNPIQEEDLCFRLIRAQFDSSVVGNVEFRLDSNAAPTSNVPMDLYYVTSGNLVLPNTEIVAAAATTLESGVKQELVNVELGENNFFNDTLGRRVATSDINSFKLRLFLGSNSKDVSPVIDLDRLSVLAIQNYCNNLGLDNSSVTVINSSTNWFDASGLTLTISGGNGSGANAYVANTQIDSNNRVLSNVVVNASGSSYTLTPSITLSGNNALTANIHVAGEDQASGGPAIARYITRKVTLADGMDAGDFRIFFTAYKPSEANIYVYYKILSSDDPDQNFDNRTWSLMTIIKGYNNVSQNPGDLKDFVYAPGSNNIADDRVQYDSFTTFKQFSIKIVMSTKDTTKVPRIKDLRIIALPALS